MEDEVMGFIDLKASYVYAIIIVFIEWNNWGKYQIGC